MTRLTCLIHGLSRSFFGVLWFENLNLADAVFLGNERETSNFGTQYDRLDGLFERMEQMMVRLSTAVAAIEERPGTGNQGSEPLMGGMAMAAQTASMFDQVRTPMDVERTTSSRSDFEYNPPSKSLAELATLVPDASNIYRSGLWFLGSIRFELTFMQICWWCK